MLYRQVIAPLLFCNPIQVTLMNDNPGFMYNVAVHQYRILCQMKKHKNKPAWLGFEPMTLKMHNISPDDK